MLTRNYYNQRCKILLSNASNASSYYGDQEIDDKFFSLKTVDGARTNSDADGIFEVWGAAAHGSSFLYPDITNISPTINDYLMPIPSDSNFKYSSKEFTIDNYNSETAEYTTTIKETWTNMSAEEQTVYGIYCAHKYNTSANNIILLAREQFASPIVVPANANVVLTLTYKVSKAGILIDNANGGV